MNRIQYQIMKTKETYSKPEIEITQLETENIIATSLNVNEDDAVGPARVKRNFWSNED